MRELPKVTVAKKTYYHDKRLKQYRNVENPHDYVDYADCELCYEGNCPHTCHSICDFVSANDSRDPWTIEMDHIITITVAGGVVVDVEGLPEDYIYVVRDLDGEQR